MVTPLRRSLSTRYGATLALITFGTCSLLLLFALYVLQTVYEQVNLTSQQAIEQSVARQLARDALLLGETLAENLEQPLYHSDFSAIEEILQHLREKADIGYIYVYGSDRHVIHDGTAEILHYGAPVDQMIPSGLGDDFSPSARELDRLMHVAYPIRSDSTTFGAVRFSVSYSDAQADIESMSTRLRLSFETVRQQVMAGLLLAFLALMVLTLLLSSAPAGA
ncbi:hypothetical protein [Marinobacterium aestuariivivens]|uniref:Single cache domain-containing protein n=1 Tax=Marinobacterium aestuariivivens TaxID=1698799 RepID=A0ABW1ZZB9_9GAMM